MAYKTYSEACGLPSSDWWKALENPFAHEYSGLRDRAWIWTTCAVGNACAVIPRDADGAPLDIGLNHLGTDFADAVEHCDFDKAKEILRAIEARSAILIAAELVKLNAHQPNP